MFSKQVQTAVVFPTSTNKNCETYHVNSQEKSTVDEKMMFVFQRVKGKTLLTYTKQQGILCVVSGEDTAD